MTYLRFGPELYAVDLPEEAGGGALLAGFLPEDDETPPAPDL